MRPGETAQPPLPDMDVKANLRSVAKKIPYIGKVFRQREELRAIVNELWVEPGHFYSPLPDLEEIRKHEDRIFAVRREIPGVKMNEAGQLALLDEIARFYGEQPFPEDPDGRTRYHFRNPAFTYSDALFLYGMIRHLQPRRIVEVGSGYSSCVTLDTNERFFGGGIACTFIEPYPRLLYSLMREGDRAKARVIESGLQDVPLSVFTELQPNDILFIDSTHVTKTDSDVNYLFFEILPSLNPGVYIHIHDVLHSFEYPAEWIYQRRAWNEAYVLRAFLQYNDAFRIELSNSFLEQFHGERLRERMPLTAKHRGLSMWIRKTGC